MAVRKNSPLAAEIRRFENVLDALEHSDDTVPGFMARLPAPSPLSERDRQAWRVLTEEMTAVAEVFSSPRRLPFVEFRKLASEIAGLRTVDRLSVSNTAPGVPQVRIIHPHSLGSRSYRWIFAPGFTDGEVSARSASNPLLPDRIIQAINERIGPGG